MVRSLAEPRRRVRSFPTHSEKAVRLSVSQSQKLPATEVSVAIAETPPRRPTRRVERSKSRVSQYISLRREHQKGQYGPRGAGGLGTGNCVSFHFTHTAFAKQARLLP